MTPPEATNTEPPRNSKTRRQVVNKRQIPSKEENGQADGVSTRPLVGEMLTLLDLREKF